MYKDLVFIVKDQEFSKDSSCVDTGYNRRQNHESVR